VTFGDVLIQYLAANMALFAAVALGAGALGGLLGWWLRGVRHSRKCVVALGWDVDEALEAWEPVFRPGVAKVGDR